MERHEGVFYRAKHKNGYGWLNTNPRQEESVDGIKEGIDYWNERAVEKGYRATQYLIVKTVWHTIYSDDGEFIESNTYEQAIEKYPKVMKEKVSDDVVQSVLP